MTCQAVDDSHISFAKRLAHNNKAVREQTLKKLQRWLITKSKNGTLNQDELLKIFKGLYYSMWYSDKPLLQEGLAVEISSMLGSLPQRSDSVEYFTAFCTTISREWTGIDRLRLDKFYMFIKTFIKRGIVFCESCEWDESVVEGIANALDEKIININCMCPDSITVFLAENLYSICSEIEGGLPARAMYQLLVPYINLLAVTPKRDMTRLLLTHLFNPLCAEESTVNVDKSALSEYIFTLARGKSILTRNRKILYTLKVKLGGVVVIETEIGEKRKRGDEENVSDNVKEGEEEMEVVEPKVEKKKKKKVPKKKKTLAEEDESVSEIISEFVPELVEEAPAVEGVVAEPAAVEAAMEVAQAESEPEVVPEPVVEPVLEPVVELVPEAEPTALVEPSVDEPVEPIVEESVEEPAVEEPVVEEVKEAVETVVAVDEEMEVVTVEEPVTNGISEPVTETPIVEEPVAVAETPVVETPVVETPVVETPIVETPVAETPVEAAAPLSAPAELIETTLPATPKPKKAKTPKSKKKKSISTPVTLDSDKFVEELFEDPEPEALTTVPEAVTPRIIKKKKTPKKIVSPVLEITPQPVKKKVRLSMENNTYSVFKKNSQIESPTTYDSTKTPTRSAIRRSTRICASAQKKKPVYSESPEKAKKTKRRKSVMT